MTQFVSNIIQSSLSGFVSGAVTTAGGYVGDALGAAGDLIERKGQSIGNGVAQTVDGWGKGISGYYGGKPTPQSSKLEEQSKPTIKQPQIRQKTGQDPAKKNPVPARAAGNAPARTAVTPGRSSSVPTSTKTGATRIGADASTLKSNKGTSALAKQTKPTTQLAKTRTAASGKVIPDRKSLPGSKTGASKTPGYSKPVTGAAYRGPIPNGSENAKQAGAYASSTRDFKPHGGYAGPLNLQGIGSSGPNAKGTLPATTMSSNKPRPGGYQGPLGSLA